MKRSLLLAGAALLASFGIAQVLAQVTLPWPGPGIGNQISCASNAVNGTFANVKYLYHFEDGTDSSGNGHTLTLGTTTTYSTAQFKFGTHSLNGGANLSGATPAGTWGPYSAGFTTEAWIYFTPDANAAQNMMDDRNTSFGGVTMRWNIGTTGTMSSGLNAVTNVNVTPALNSWHHYAWSGTAGNVPLFFVDGVSQAGVTGAWPATIGAGGMSNGPLTIMMQFGGSSVKGYMDEMRISDVQRYTGTFTPQTSAFCNS